MGIGSALRKEPAAKNSTIAKISQGLKDVFDMVFIVTSSKGDCYPCSSYINYYSMFYFYPVVEAGHGGLSNRRSRLVFLERSNAADIIITCHFNAIFVPYKEQILCFWGI